jgi:oxygen-dependent protoporphyrinogen oxidase
VGGAIQTRPAERPEGRWIVEIGPNTVVDSRPEVGRLLAAADLAGEKLVGGAAAGKRYIWKGDRLHPLPGGPLSFLTTPLFTAGGKARFFREPFIGRPRHGREETVAEFVRRRLGASFLDYAVGPFVSGVYAGDPERLSVRWAVSRVWALEDRHGGLVRGAVAKMLARPDRAAGDPKPTKALLTFAAGLATLPERLAAAVPVTTGVTCRTLRRDGEGFTVVTDAGETSARHVVVTTSSDAAAGLLAGATGGRSAAFADIPYAPVAIAAYGFRREDVGHPLDGFGFLAPRCESLRILGCLFPSSIFPGRAPDGHVLLTAFAGGRTDPEAVALSDDGLDRVVRGDLARAVGLRGEPVFRSFSRWPRAIPQYEVGHGRYVELATRLEEELPGLHLAGNYLHGVSVPDRIVRGTMLAEAILGQRAH